MTDVTYCPSGLPAGGLAGVLAHGAAGAVGVVQPAFGEHDTPRVPLPASWRAQLSDRERLSWVEVREQAIEVGESQHQRQVVAERPTGSEALEIPGHVLAELLAAPLLPHVEREQLRVTAHHLADLPQRRKRRDLLAGEGGREVAEQPRSAEAAAAHDDTSSTGLLDHAESI